MSNELTLYECSHIIDEIENIAAQSCLTSSNSRTPTAFASFSRTGLVSIVLFIALSKAENIFCMSRSSMLGLHIIGVSISLSPSKRLPGKL